MSSPKLNLNSEFLVHLFHVCSGCGFPVVSTAKILVSAQKATTLNTPEGARQILKKTTATAVQSAIDMINRCRKDRVALDPGVFGMHSMGLSHYYNSRFYGYETPCPYCLNIEPWQRVSGAKHLLSELDEVNFPYVTRHLDKAEKWACDYVAELIDEIDELRSELDAEDIRKAETEAAQTAASIRDLVQIYSSLPERIRVKELETRFKELTKEKKLLGALELAKKAELSKSIKATQRALRVEKETLSESELPIKNQLRYEREKLLKAQATAFGCTDQIETVIALNSICYHYTPNEPGSESSEDTDYELELDLEDETEFVQDDETDRVQEDDAELMQEDELENEVKTETGEPTPSFCRKCGNKLPDDSVYCPYCGSKI